MNGDVGVEEEKRVEQHFDETAIAFQEISQMRHACLIMWSLFISNMILYLITVSCDYLLDMVYTDLEPHLDQLFNKKWFGPRNCEL